MMASVAARELADGEVVFVGIGLPNLACNLARRTHAPNLVLIYESGAVGATPTRLPGSGGAAEIAIHAQRILIVSKLSPRAFPERVDFLTSPGERVAKVITDKGVLERDAENGGGELVLAALYPGVEMSDVHVGWKLRCRSRLSRLEPPTKLELQLLRDVLDPQRLYLKS